MSEPKRARGVADGSIPPVRVSLTARELVTTPMVEYNLLMSVEHDIVFNDRNRP